MTEALKFSFDSFNVLGMNQVGCSLQIVQKFIFITLDRCLFLPMVARYSELICASTRPQTAGFNSTINTQTITCKYSSVNGLYWSTPVNCVPVTCSNPPPADPGNALKTIVYSANQTTNQQYQTNITYFCPLNQSLPNLISSNFTFNYNPTSIRVYNVSSFCEIDRCATFLMSRA